MNPTPLLSLRRCALLLTLSLCVLVLWSPVPIVGPYTPNCRSNGNGGCGCPGGWYDCGTFPGPPGPYCGAGCVSRLTQHRARKEDDDIHLLTLHAISFLFRCVVLFVSVGMLRLSSPSSSTSWLFI
jgi:hypothetical protein